MSRLEVAMHHVSANYLKNEKERGSSSFEMCHDSPPVSRRCFHIRQLATAVTTTVSVMLAPIREV